MSDIDFDELDKAVNTLMGGVSATTPVKTDNVKTLTIDSTIPDDSHPSLEKLDATLAQVNGPVAPVIPKPAEPTASPAPVRPTAPSLANRRAGRFMDVVHPSSVKPGLKPASRVGATIQPAGVPVLDGIKAPSADVQSDNPSSDSYSSMTVSDVVPQPDTSTVAQKEAPATTDWPDPLDMSGYGTEPEANDVSAKTPENTAIEVAPVTNSEDDEQQSLVSPFIADAKVEKRPLGGVPIEVSPVDAPEAPVAAPLDAEELSLAEDASDQLPVDPPAPAIQLPPELQSDLMAIETDGDTAPSVPTSPTQSSSIPVNHPAVDATPSSPVVKPEAPTASAASVGATSIPQQYHEEPSTSDASNGSIYDTASYHQPIAHPAKTKSGWLWIIWILLLLLVGGGGAVALYFVGII